MCGNRINPVQHIEYHGFVDALALSLRRQVISSYDIKYVE